MKCSSMAMTFMRARSSSIGLDAGAAQQAAEARQLLAHVGVELLRSHRHRLRAEVGEPLQHLRRLQRARDLEVEPIDDRPRGLDRKSTRLNSSHTVISYAVFCLKKKKHT